MDDFRKYATKHLGMSSMVLDDVIKSQAGYLNPYILEERQLNVTQLDVFSRLAFARLNSGFCTFVLLWEEAIKSFSFVLFIIHN